MTTENVSTCKDCKVELTFSWDHLDVTDKKIVYCPLHAAAPELLEISRLVAHPRFIMDEQGNIRYYVTKSDIAAAREAIRKAESK